MRTLISSCLLIPLLVLTNSSRDEPQAKDSSGWRPLFNGKTLDGWEHVGPGKMVVEDGLIRTEGGMGLLWFTGEKFGDCIIRVVYKTTAHDANAGVHIRFPDKPNDAWDAVLKGYEIQICDVQDEFHGTGSIYSLVSKMTARPAKPAGEWNTMEITLKRAACWWRSTAFRSTTSTPTRRRSPNEPRNSSRRGDHAPRPATSACRIMTITIKPRLTFISRMSV